MFSTGRSRVNIYFNALTNDKKEVDDEKNGKKLFLKLFYIVSKIGNKMEIQTSL